MLGRFLEFSVATPDIAASLAFYTGLGFSQADVGDAWRHPYAVLSDGRIHIGLHQLDIESPQITFVRPRLLQAVDALEQVGIELEVRRLGNDQFNEIAWRDPAGHLIRLVEARTFSPARLAQAPPSACGRFLEIALPVGDIAMAKEFWERLGFIGMQEGEGGLAHVCCMSDTINIGLYEAHELRAPALLFEADEAQPARAAPHRTPGPIRAPEGTALQVQRGAGT